MIKNLFIGVTAAFGFFVATVIMSFLQMGAKSLIPGENPDPPGALKPTAEERAKKDWEAQQKAQGIKPVVQLVNSKEKTSEPGPARSSESKETAERNEPSTQKPSAPRGPGNIDSYKRPSFPTGPGNIDSFTGNSHSLTPVGPGNM